MLCEQTGFLHARDRLCRSPGSAPGSGRSDIGLRITIQVPSPPRHATKANRIAAAIAATVLIALGGAYYFSCEPAPAVPIRWRDDMTWQRRAEIERRFGLVQSRDQDVRITYDLTDTRPSNIAALLEQPEVLDTGDLDLRSHTVPADAPYGRGWMWVGSRLPVLRIRGAVPALVIASALVIGGWLVKELGLLRSRPRDESRASRIAAATAAVVLAALGGAYYATSERAPAVAIRWREGVSEDRRVAIERQFRLRRPREPEGRSMLYDLVDIRSANIEGLLEQSEVEDTSRIDRHTLTIPANTAFGQGNMWVGNELFLLRTHGVVPAIVVTCLMVIAYPLIRRAGQGMRTRS
jgi:hypothetical protein